MRRTRRIDGQVAVPSTSVKGMLRSEFEMVTNSRFGVFDEQERRLGYRLSTRDSQGLVPVQVVVQEQGRALLQLRGMDGPGGEDTLMAAWVPTYGPTPARRYGAVAHGSCVTAWVVLVQRQPASSKETPFHYWRVTALGVDSVPKPADVEADRSWQGRKHRHQVVDGTQRQIRGWYFHSNENIGNKHDERIFFQDTVDPTDESTWPALAPVEEQLACGWSDVIASYHDAHNRSEIHERRDGSRLVRPTESIGHTPGKTAWSWHLIPEGDELDRLKALPSGTLCYAEYSGHTVSALYPVALSRRLYEISPQELAENAHIAPAPTATTLSPADRLFGWVARGRKRRAGTQSVRGRIRVGLVSPVGQVVPHKIGRALAIQAQPRPTQDLFYAAAKPNGAPLANAPGYREGQGLRGFKVYPHQPNWESESGWARQSGEVDRQNAELVDWVPPGSAFELDLQIEDATEEELGALLYVLSGDGAAGPRLHKLGGGKPLGFGSVTIEVLHSESDMRLGEAWRSYFALDPEPGDPECGTTATWLDEGVAGRLIATFTRDRSQQSYLLAYEHYLQGFPDRAPVHYPEDPGQPGSDADRYQWFVDNRKAQRRGLGALDRGYDKLLLPTDPKNGTGR